MQSFFSFLLLLYFHYLCGLCIFFLFLSDGIQPKVVPSLFSPLSSFSLPVFGVCIVTVLAPENKIPHIKGFGLILEIFSLL